MHGLMMDVPLSIPLLLRRTETLFAHKTLVSRRADRSLERRTYGEVLRRARGLAAGLASLGIKRGDRVATFCWNHSRHLEAYYGVPASGAVLHTLNIRLHADELAYIIRHAGDAAIIVDKVLWPAFAAGAATTGRYPDRRHQRRRRRATGNARLRAAGDVGDADRDVGRRRRAFRRGDVLHIGHHGAIQGRARTRTARWCCTH